MHIRLKKQIAYRSAQQISLILATLIVSWLWATGVSAQAFGPGGPVGGTGSLTTPSLEIEGVGILGRNERFRRASRSPLSFVGPDRRELRRLIGRIQSSETQQAQPTQTALSLEQPQTGTSVNQQRQPSGPNEMYDPTLTVGFGQPPLESCQVEQSLRCHLSSLVHRGCDFQIDVSVAERVATLSGVVATGRCHDLAMMLARLEPGVSRVQSQLVVLAESPNSMLERPIEVIPAPPSSR